MAKSLYRMENIKLAELLRSHREQAGLVQSALAERLGRNQTFVSTVELAIRRLDLVELRDYCSGLGVELQQIIAQWEVAISEIPKPIRGKRKK